MTATNATSPFVEVAGLHKHFSIGPVLSRRTVRAVNDVSFDIAKGETLGLVGESGSGKSTLGRVLVGLIPSTAGHSTIGGQSVEAMRGADRRALWRRSQMVFQDPYSSLNPKMTIRDALAEPLRNFGIARGGEADNLIRTTLDACGLGASALERYPREFSGGQRQRVGIARALIVRPDFIIADEPVSALDVSIQAQIINLLQDLKQSFGLTYLFIAHDLAVVRHVSDRIAVMYLGKIVELGSSDVIYRTPLHPYTQLLLRSIPAPDPALERARRAATKRVESRDMQPPENGCPFAPRCPLAQFPICSEQEPPLRPTKLGHLAACHFADAGTLPRSAQAAAAATAPEGLQ